MPVDIDWDSFCHHPKYTVQQDITQLTRIIENIFRILHNVVTDVNSNTSFAGLCKNDKIFKEGTQT
jgi:hypothetical protein